MSTRGRRIRSGLAAFAPLVVLALAVLTLVPPRYGIDAALGGTMVFGMGPLSLVAVPNWSFGVIILASVLLWSGYAIVIACTRFGLAPWPAHAILSTAWCAVGVVSTLFASLAV
jgi:hypothetical protein